MIRKYGKEINMRSLNRNIETIRNLVDHFKNFAIQNLEPYNEKIKYECRICHSKKHIPFTKVIGYSYNFCLNCNSIILLNIPDVKKLYESENMQASCIYLNDENFLKRVNSIAVPKLNFVLETIFKKHNEKEAKSEIAFCDAGCGVGELLMAMKMHNDMRVSKKFGGGGVSINGVGIEIDPNEINFARSKGLKVVEGFLDANNPVCELTEIIKKTDVLSMLNVLEHIEYPDKLIEYLAYQMKQGAFLVIEVPRHPSLASFANLISPDLTYRHIAPPVHLQVFSEKGIRKLVKSKFKLIATWGFGQGFTDLLTSAMLLGNIKEMELYQSLMNISNDVQKVIDKKGFSDQMIYILEKR